MRREEGAPSARCVTGGGGDAPSPGGAGRGVPVPSAVSPDGEHTHPARGERKHLAALSSAGAGPKHLDFPGNREGKGGKSSLREKLGEAGAGAGWRDLRAVWGTRGLSPHGQRAWLVPSFPPSLLSSAQAEFLGNDISIHSPFCPGCSPPSALPPAAVPSVGQRSVPSCAQLCPAVP